MIKIEKPDSFVKFMMHCISHYEKYLRQTKIENADFRLLNDIQSRGMLKGTPLEKNKYPIPHFAVSELIKKYGISITFTARGLTAVLPKNKWAYPLNKEIPAGDYGSFFADCSDEEKEELLSILGGGFSLKEAVFKCVLNARTAGVI